MKKQLNKKESAELLKVLADEVRLNILDSISLGKKCVGELVEELKLSQPRVSHHLKILKVAGIIESHRDAHKIYYSLTPKIEKRFSEKTTPLLDLGCCQIQFKRKIR